MAALRTDGAAFFTNHFTLTFWTFFAANTGAVLDVFLQGSSKGF